jgi:uncharacterized membrane protein YphA (DoxX/SURF4 family)
MSLWFGASGFFELTRNPVVWDITLKLGYPAHFIYILGVFKILGSIILLIPNRFNRIKEWIFAGMFFGITFAFFSKAIVLGFSSTIDAIIAFVVLAITYYLFNKIHCIDYTENMHND